MYVVLKKGKKAQIVKEETYELRPSLYKHYEVVKRTDSWKDSQDLLRKIKRNEPLEVQSLPAVPVNVKWEVRPNGAAFVYGLYDDKDKLLYIGVTSSPNLRCENHIKNGKTFSYMKVLFKFNSREEGDSFERFAISSLNPPINILVEGIVPGSVHDIKSLNLFGELSDVQPLPKISTYKKRRPRTVKPPKQKRVSKKQTPTVFCNICEKAIGKNNQMFVGNGTYVHKKACSRPPTPMEIAQRRQKAREAKIEKKRESKTRRIEANLRNERLRNPTSGISKICVICSKVAKSRNVVYIKDANDNRALIHKGCYDKRLQELKESDTLKR